MLNAFKEFLKNNDIEKINKNTIEDFITSMYYDLFDNLDSIEEIAATENNIRKKLYSIYNIK